LSCKETPPEIAQQYWQLNLFHDLTLQEKYEQLSLFVHVEDEDGKDDIESVYLINDKNELFWKIEQEDWEEQERAGEFWMGTNTIVMNDYSRLPRGDYRVIVIDSAGERDRREIFIPETDYSLDRISFPSAEITEEETIVVSSDYDEHSIWIYQRNWAGLTQVKLSGDTIAFSDLFEEEEQRRSAHSFYVYAYNESIGAGVITGPYYF
jgi:hypothetical protein